MDSDKLLISTVITENVAVYSVECFRKRLEVTKLEYEKLVEKKKEESLFKGVFEQIGKSLSKKALGKAVPVAGAVIGAMFDTAQMNTVLEYADVFYNKRYLLEKEVRINTLLGVSSPIESVVIDVLEKDIVSVEDGESELQVE